VLRAGCVQVGAKISTHLPAAWCHPSLPAGVRDTSHQNVLNFAVPAATIIAKKNRAGVDEHMTVIP
jgi:hypothetical protein